MRMGIGKCVVALGMVVLPACSADVGDESPVNIQPTTGIEPRALAPTGGHGPALKSNAQRYKDTGAHPATGRSGSATLLARALLGKDGDTDLELTTGQTFDTSVAPPGNISKVQLKVLAANGDAVLTHNVNKLSGGGYVDEKVPGLHRGEKLQVQTNIGGIDGNRTDVVTMPAKVVLRPDLAASDLRTPKRAWQQSAVLVGATIRELNGDVGATANCVMAVDGVEVDHADGIWVDAGGTVSCRFEYRFPSVGVHNVTISAANVVPGDWDLANNGVSSPIEIVAPVPVEYSASASDLQAQDSSARWHYYDYASWYSYWSYWSYYGYGGYGSQQVHEDYSYGSDQSAHNQSAQFDVTFGRAVSFPLTRLALGETSDGTALASTDLSGQPADSTTTWTAGGLTIQDSCIQRWNGNATVFVCTSARSDGTGETHVHSNRSAGDVTYHSYNYYYYYSSGYSCSYGYYYGNGCSSWQYGPYYYSSNYSGSSSSGTFVPMGSRYNFNLQLTDGDLAYAPVDAAVALQPFSSSWGSPNRPSQTCTNDYYSTWNYSYGSYWYWSSDSGYQRYVDCYYENHTTSGVRGSVSNVQSSAPPSP